MADREHTLAIIGKRMEQLGDLPIFSASVNRIRRISTDPDSTALALSQEITKDANLSAKLLRLANSSYYNRGNGKIGVMSRAVVVLGFNTIKNICLTLKLIDSFQHDHPSIDMNRMLVNAYLAAGFVREVALRCGVKDVEETYTCALLHNLGEIAVAYFLPEKYMVIKRLQETSDKGRREIEQTVLGTSAKEVGQELARCWEFPSTIVKTMEHYDPESGAGARSGVSLNRALAALGNTVVETLHGGARNGERLLSELISDMAETAGLDHALIQHGLVDSFKMSCELAGDYGLKRGLLLPDPGDSGDEYRDRLAGKLSYYASTYRPRDHALEDSAPATAAVTPASAPFGPNEDPAPGSPPLPDSAPDSTPDTTLDPDQAGTAGDTRVPVTETDPLAGVREPPATNQPAALVQLEIIQEITALLSAAGSLNEILTKALEGLHRGVGFDRALLILLSPDRGSYAARLAVGRDTDRPKRYFHRPLEAEHDLFSKVILEGDEAFVEDTGDEAWRPLLPEGYASQVRARSFMLGALRHGSKPIGLFYADNASSGAPITPDQQRGFHQFLAQARLAIRMTHAEPS